jgi:hypothetical protein
MPACPATLNRSALGLAVLLAILTLALFWPATGYDYVRLDDDQYVASNPHVLTGLTPANIRWAFTTVYEAWWLPLLWLSFMLDTELFGPEPFGYHLTNILLHAANAALLFWFLTAPPAPGGAAFSSPPSSPSTPCAWSPSPGSPPARMSSAACSSSSPSSPISATPNAPRWRARGSSSS